MNPLNAWKRKRRNLLLARQLRTALQTLVHGLRTGASFLQALDRVAREGDEPLAGEWRRVLHAVQVGDSLPRALTELEERVPVKEFAWFVTAVRISQETGGPLTAILDNLASTLQERELLREKISTLTAPGKASGALLSLMPLMMLTALGWVAPEFVRPLFHTRQGGLLLLATGCLLAAGLYVISKIVSIPVD